MSSEFTTLGQFATIQGGYAYKSNDFKSSENWPVLKIKNVRVGRIDYSDVSFVSDEIAKATSKWQTEVGDVLISMTGSGPSAPDSLVGRVGKVRRGEPPALINQRVGRLLMRDGAKIDKSFLYHLLSLPETQQYLVANATGSANQVNISAKTIESILCPNIDFYQSKVLSEFLDAIDDRIALLRETNATLESIAQALFKSWFVDFDPVRAKMEGHAPEGMVEATAALFPDSFEESELGLQPKGWLVKRLDEISEVGIGKTPPRKEPEWFSDGSEAVRWVSIRDMGVSGVYIADTAEGLVPEAIDRFNVRRVPDNTVLLSFKLTVGRVSITDGEMTTNEAIAHCKLRQEDPLPTEFIYLYLKQFDFGSLGSTSSIAEAVNSKTIKLIPIIAPSNEVVSAFHSLVSGIFQRLKENERQAKTLTALRDTLLPRLISGQLRLSELTVD